MCKQHEAFKIQEGHEGDHDAKVKTENEEYLCVNEDAFCNNIHNKNVP